MDFSFFHKNKSLYNAPKKRYTLEDVKKMTTQFSSLFICKFSQCLHIDTENDDCDDEESLLQSEKEILLPFGAKFCWWY